jgi:FkbM family methyltransferase
MSLKASVRDAISRNATTHRWFVALCARFTMRLYNFQSYLSLEDLRAKRRAALWRQFLGLLGRPNLDKVVISGGKAVFHYTDGCAFLASASPNSISSTQYSHGDYEASETRVMAGLVQPGWTVVDAGANFGWHAIHLAKDVGPQGTVLAFEPIPASFQELTENTALNDCPQLKPLNLALGDQDGTISLYLPAVHLGAGAASQFLDMGEKVQVPMLRLDGFLEREGIDRVDFIKADIEGGELNLLRGAAGLLARCRPAILIEIVDIHCKRFGHGPNEVIGYLAGHGYAGKFIDAEGNLVPYDATRPPNGNYLFT